MPDRTFSTTGTDTTKLVGVDPERKTTRASIGTTPFAGGEARDAVLPFSSDSLPVNPWRAFTEYVPGQAIVTMSGQIVVAKVQFTSL